MLSGPAWHSNNSFREHYEVATLILKSEELNGCQQKKSQDKSRVDTEKSRVVTEKAFFR